MSQLLWQDVLTSRNWEREVSKMASIRGKGERHRPLQDSLMEWVCMLITWPGAYNQGRGMLSAVGSEANVQTVHRLLCSLVPTTA